MIDNVVTENDTRPDILEAMRELADRGGSVREIVDLVQSELGRKNQSLLPVLWYFMKAFSLPLSAVLPIREWLHTGNDTEIDAQILPAIKKMNTEESMTLAKPS